MQKVINLFTRRKISTQRVDDLPSDAARLALDQRLHRMLAAHATVPVPVHDGFALLSNPIKNAANS